MPSRRVGRRQEAHLNRRGVCKPSQKDREESGVPHRGREGWKALPESWEWLGGPGKVRSPSERAGIVRRPTKRAGRGREALLESQDWFGGQGKAGSPSRGAEGNQEAL